MPPDARVLTPAELLAIRQRLGLSQVAVARALGISRDSYGGYERGTRTIPAWMDPAMRAIEADVRGEAA